MISDRIWCSRCGHEGPREMKGAVAAESTAKLFTSQGHDPYSGKLYFRCPQCGAFIAVDPNDALASYTMNGYPCPLDPQAAELSRTRSLLTVLGSIYTGLMIVILITQLIC